MTTLAALLDRLGIGGDELVAVCHDRGGRFTFDVTTATDAPRLAAQVNGDANVWFGVNPLRHAPPSGRGSASDVSRLSALFADLDVKPGALPSERAALAVMTDLDGVLGVPWRVAVATGHGFHVYWPVADGDDTDRAGRLLARFGVLVRMVCERHGGTADNVQDMARILRVPGTTNVKQRDDPKPVQLTTRDDPDTEDDPLTLDRIEEALDDYGVPWPQHRDDTRQPVSSPSAWQHTDRTCGYAEAMVEGWQHDTPGARHPWLVAQAIRLTAAHRYGCLTEQAHTAALAALDHRFRVLLAEREPRREPTPREVTDALAHARQVVSRHTDTEVAAELGKHPHTPPASVTLLAPTRDGSDPLADLEPQLFDLTPTLTHIRQAAWSRLESPWAVLGSVLARVVAEVPANYCLPPTVGTHGALNLAALLVGPSGGGKTVTHHIAGELLPPIRARRVGGGTGEGLAETFLRWDPDLGELVLRDPPERHALMYVDEIATLGAIQSRNGSTTAATLRTMLSGGELSFTNADNRRRRHLPAMSYRIGAVCGVQPALSGVLFDDTDAGTPQRFIWQSTWYPNLPDPEPDWPGPLTWTLPTIPPRLTTPTGLTPLTIPTAVADHIRQQHRLRKQGNADPLDGHRDLTRAKVATALSLLHGEPGMTEAMWNAAAVIMEASARTREHCRQVLAQQAEQTHRARGRADAHREAGAREARTLRATRQAAALWRAVSRHATGEGSNSKHDPADGCTRRCLTYPLRHHPDADPDAVIGTAEQLGYIDHRDGRWFPGPSQPSDTTP